MFQIDIQFKASTLTTVNRPVELTPNAGGQSTGFVGQLLAAETNMQPAEQDGSPLLWADIMPTQEGGLVLAASPQSAAPMRSRASIDIAPIVNGWHRESMAATDSVAIGETHLTKAHLAETQSENGTLPEPSVAQIEPDILPDVSVAPMELSVTGLPLTPSSELLAASPIPVPNVETMAKENQKSIDSGQADPTDQAVIPSLFQPMPRSEFPRDGLQGAAVGPLSQEPGWSDVKPMAPNAHLPSRGIGGQSPVENLAPSVAQLRQSIDYHFAMDTADQKTGAYSTSAPPIAPPSQDIGGISGFQNLFDAGPVDANVAPLLAAMPASNAKSSPDAALPQSEASILPDINAQPKLDDRVRVVQSDNTTIRLLAEADTLGKMAISLSLFENGTEVAFRTESAETARQLNNAGSQLANRLDEVGGRQSRVTVEMTDHGGLSNGFAQDGSRQPRSSENWTGPKTSQSAAVGTENGAKASAAPQKAGRLA